MIKIKTKKLNCFPGDKDIQIIAIDGKRQVQLMNICRKSCRGGIFYKSDTMSNTFKTITEAKQWCLANLDLLAPNWRS